MSVNFPWINKWCVLGNTATLGGKEAKYFNAERGGTQS
jgi:hypothetical protein